MKTTKEDIKNFSKLVYSSVIIVRENCTIWPEDIKRAEQVLVDNGIDRDEADTVLQAIGYALLDTELYPENE